MEKTQSFPSREFEELLANERAKKLLEIDPNTISGVHNRGKITVACVYKVIDGDTIKVLYHHGDNVQKIDIRVNGVDTPETRRASDLEKKAGRVVTRIVSNKIHNRLIAVKFLKKDKYGGRIVGDVYLPGEKSLCEYLIENKLGHPYTGKTKKESWTPEELDYIIGFREEDS
uniref:Thermonuclease/nuclease n=1 Tax=Marseillevirus LCMAC101 TaxID=2506602 RepID=A0A481YT98_9VIRU|nr:MAG: thermonuclease/nuclease [Marseillevirus LCMAC101]